MFWQQKITPSTADPAQQRIMMIMPLMFTASCSSVAERPGALLVRQQPLGDRPAVLHELVDRTAGCGHRRPPAERRLKNAGTGRTAGAENKN